MKCRFCKRSLRGIGKLPSTTASVATSLHDTFTERFNRKCPKSSDGACWRQTQTVVKAGSGKKAMNIVFDDAAVPSRGARLGTRARWASEYLRRFFSGQKADKKSISLALKWIDEAIERCSAPATSKTTALGPREELT